MTVRTIPTIISYRTLSPVSREDWAIRESPLRSSAHGAPVGFHVGEEILPGAGGRLEPVSVEGELVHELVQRRFSIGDAGGLGDQEHLPFFELLDVVYGCFEAGAVVEQEARSFQVFVAGDEVVARGRGIGRDGGRLRFLCGERAVRVGPYVGCSQRQGKRMIACDSSGMIEDGQ